MSALYDQDMLRALLLISALGALVAGFFALHYFQQSKKMAVQLAKVTQERDRKQQPCPICPPSVVIEKSPICPVCSEHKPCPEVAKGHDQPPIITLAETERRFRFDSGSAVLSFEFREALYHDVVTQIVAAQQRYGVNMVQIIGHTDEMPLGNKGGTLDQNLVESLWNGVRVLAGSNVDLAMVRAIEVMKALREDGRLARFNMVPYSAGQVLMPGDILSIGEKVPNPARRRVVIRLTRS